MAKRGRPRKVKEIETTEAATATAEPVVEADNLIENIEEETPATIVKAPIGNIRAKISKVKVAPKYDVWMGVVKDSPFWTIHAGGRDFSQVNEIVGYDEDTRATTREKVNGKVVELSKVEIDYIATEVGKKVIRKYGPKGSILNTTDPRYTFAHNDIPLGQYVFMKVLEANLPHDWRNKLPEAMA